MGNPPILGEPPARTPCLECRHCRAVVTESRPAFFIYVICGHDYGRRIVTHYRDGCSNWDAGAAKEPGRWRARLEEARGPS